MYRRRYRWQVAGRVVRTTGPAAVIGWVAGLILMSLSACSGAVDPSTEPGPATFQTHPTSPVSVLPETTSSSRPTEPYTEAAAEAAFREAYAAHVDYLVDRSQIEGVTDRFADPAKVRLLELGEDLETTGTILEVPAGSLAPQQVVTRLVPPDRATIDFCSLDASVQRDGSTGQVTDDDHAVYLSRAAVVLREGHWWVDDVVIVQERSLSEGCD